ncbi:MAG: hypothetical protein IPH89_01020 [Bacteroidetes bacterium]|nr:hypothetical protein [Bacteroidota bacterium]
MIKNYKLKTSIAFALVCFLIAFTSLKAQVSAYSFSSSAGVYTPIAGGTNNASTSATVIDDNVYTNQPIGFTFRYDGVDYTAFGMNGNGWISLGATAPASSTTPLSGGTTNNVISAAGTDLLGRLHSTANRTTGTNQITVTAGDYSAYQVGDAVTGTGIPAGSTITAIAGNVFTISNNATSNGTGFNFRVYKPTTGIRFETIGLAPNRKLVVQWSNFARYSTAGGSVADNISFQIVLTETTNAIDVIYNIPTASTFATYPSFQVGLRGASNADFNNRKTTTDWSATTAGTVNTDNNSLTATVFPVNGQTYSWVPPVPCAGTPAAGTTAGPVGACPSVNFGLSLTGATSGVTGLTYQWQSSPDGLTYTNIAATTATATVNQTAVTYYQCIVTCSNGGAADTSAALLVPMSSFLNCYCSSGLTTTGGGGDIVTNVVLTNSIPVSLTQASGGAAPWFTSYNNTPLDLLRGTTNNTVAITMGTDGTQWSAAWVDWNQNGSFEASENIGLASAAALASATVTYTFAVPANAVLGNTRIRVRGGSDGAYTAAGACAGIGYGETEDYIVNIICPTITAPIVTGASICSGNTATVSAIPSLTGSTLTWFDAASGGANLGTGASYTTPVLTATTSYWVEESIPGCAASPRSQADATVIPVGAVLTPIDVTCNGGSDGSFALGAVNCGTTPFDYSVNGGSFGAIPTNLVAGTYSVVIRDASLGLSAPISVVVGQPTWTINNPTASNISTCQGSVSAILTANATLNPLATGTQTLTFGLSAQPTEVSGGSTFPAIATTPNIISSATLTALPVGAVVTGVTFSFPNLTPTGGSFGNDVGFGFTGAVSTGYAAGIGAPAAAANFNYNSTLAIGSVNIAGGTVNLNYYDLYADNAGSECTFPTGASVATMTINYTYPTQASISWWDAASSGTQLGLGNTLESVGTSVLANTTTPGTYNFYAQGNNLGCTSAARTLVTVTVKPTTTGSQTLTVCAGGSVTVGTTTHTTTGVFTDVITGSNGCDSTVTTNLTVSPAITGSQTLTVCAGGSVTVGTTTHNTTGVFTDVLLAANGCDSTVTTNLTVSPAITGSQTVTVCAGGSVTVEQQLITQQVCLDVIISSKWLR